ncbi:MAG: bifunctional diaminohydroxyphosphoribosylaminopyrimidine deaminase/5-amino-6-(5-phosphoribosylamino)uracil reductase RibD [Desulfobulbaceae bacterium]|jgi:diaminohydroxyphosphoribosylaminopyrimidine deaminase/5-amino-6-(5-phosphoribosylamino)uracil reductase|nr:bifunctional diaminohydroxyphosphoribosylaminopyrimidine deaminase/5-amino-6-(5-phosphoribosylamino)uracil reductase RibD [Desulfobulbaceae bacterium]
MTRRDVDFMRLALDEAGKGQGRTSPNPCVGALVVRDGIVVGRGYHHRAGGPHAEVNAIADAGGSAAGATLYVTLEPCNHFGRTPPCTRAILDAGIARVVVGMADPNPRVEGGGSAYLRSCGLEVETGVLEEECRKINLPFHKHVTTGLPWVVMKAGMSLDGKISYLPGRGGRITGEQSRLCTHRLRNTLDAVCIGVGTALIDDPSLTTRLPEEEAQRDPLRIVIDTHLRLQAESRMVSQHSSAPTWVFCGPDAPGAAEERLARAGAAVHRLPLDNDGRIDLHRMLVHLGQAGITSILVEGGAAVHGSFLRARLVDEVYLFIAPFFIGGQGTSLVEGFTLPGRDDRELLRHIQTRRLNDDILIHGYCRPL